MYAQLQSLRREHLTGQPSTTEQFTEDMDDYKQETAKLVQIMLDNYGTE